MWEVSSSNPDSLFVIFFFSLINSVSLCFIFCYNLCVSEDMLKIFFFNFPRKNTRISFFVFYWASDVEYFHLLEQILVSINRTNMFCYCDMSNLTHFTSSLKNGCVVRYLKSALRLRLVIKRCTSKDHLLFIKWHCSPTTKISNCSILHQGKNKAKDGHIFHVWMPHWSAQKNLQNHILLNQNNHTEHSE